MTDLPEGWASTRLEDIAEVRLGRQRSPSRAIGPNMRPYVRAANVTWAGIDTSDLKEMDFTPEEFKTYRLERGDILLGEASGSQSEVGKPAVWNDEVPDCCFQNTLIRVRPPASLVPYLHAHFVADARLGHFARAARGVGIHHLGQAALAGWSIKLAPFNEQRRIVSKIEALTARSRTAREALEQVPPLLERFRQSVLAAAFRGDLTAEWRRQHPDVEPASVLLERIRAERGRESRWKAEVDADALPPLPTGWCWASWADLSERVTVGYVGPMVNEYRPRGVPFLRSQNVRENRFDPSGLLYVSREFHEKIAKSALRPGDLVVVRSGSVGVTCAIPESLGEEANCSDVVVIQRPQGVLSSYGSYYMNSAARGHVRAGAVGVALTHFNTKSVAGLPVPVPPVEEQREIVRILDSRMAATRAVEGAAREQAERLKQLDKAVLAKAFRGELVPQDPNDEPASVLLDRIRAEREAAGAGGTRARRGRRGRASEAEATDVEDEPEDAPTAAHATSTNGNGSTLHAVLGALKREALHRIADAEGVELADRRSLDAARVGVIEGGVTLDAALEHLDRDELKAACRALGLEDRGRTKEELRTRVRSLDAGPSTC